MISKVGQRRRRFEKTRVPNMCIIRPVVISPAMDMSAVVTKVWRACIMRRREPRELIMLA